MRTTTTGRYRNKTGKEQSDQLILRGQARRDGLGIMLIAVSAVGIALNGVLFPYLRRPGGILQQVSTGILFGRAIQFAATSIRRQRLLPQILTVTELFVDGVATVAGFWAWILQPFLRHRTGLPGTAASRPWGRHMTPDDTARAVAVSRVAAVASFILHTIRIAIYLSPGRGLRESALVAAPKHKRRGRK